MNLEIGDEVVYETFTRVIGGFFDYNGVPCVEYTNGGFDPISSIVKYKYPIIKANPPVAFKELFL
jgi:hypothetical protein